jgi:hypothetical protein
MLALADPAVEAARTTRELMANIHGSMAAQQIGEAFMDMPAIPDFLRRRRDDPPDTTPMPEWILKKAAERPQNSFKRKIEDVPDVDAGLSGIEMEARTLKRSAAAELKAKDQANAAAKESKARAQRNKRLGLPEDAPADTPPAGYWDAGRNRWLPEGYMSLDRYRRLLLGMPGPAYRAAFIKAYGATQEERHRDPDAKTMRLLRHTMSIAEPMELPAPKGQGPSAPAKQPTTKAAPAAPKAKAPAPAKPKAKAKDSIAQSKSVGPEGNRVTSERETQMLALLDRAQGCTLEELGAPFGWLPHTAGARLSALKHHHTIVKTKEPPRGTVYRRATKESK